MKDKLEIGKVYKFIETESIVYSMSGEYTVKMFDKQTCRIKPLKVSKNLDASAYTIEIWDAKHPNEKQITDMTIHLIEFLVEDDGLPWDHENHPGEIWNPVIQEWRWV